MDKSYWLETWENEQIFFNQSAPNPRLQKFFPAMQLEPGQQIFIPLCGKSIDMIWLAEQGLHIIGNELSHLAVADFFKENKLTFKQYQETDFDVFAHDPYLIYEGDFFKLQPNQLKNIRAVYDRGGLVALPAKMREAYAAKMTQLVPKDCVILLLTVEYHKDTNNGPPFSVTHHDVERYYKDHFQIEILDEESSETTTPPLLKRGIAETINRVYLLTKK